MKKINIGCNAIILKDGKVLLGKRKNCTGEGTWGLPGGHLEFGESLEEAVKREAKEELGIEVKDLKLVSVTEGAKTADSHYVQINFVIEDYSGEPKIMEPDKCAELNYFNFDNLPEIFPPHMNILKAYSQKVVYLQ